MKHLGTKLGEEAFTLAQVHAVLDAASTNPQVRMQLKLYVIKLQILIKRCIQIPSHTVIFSAKKPLVSKNFM